MDKNKLMIDCFRLLMPHIGEHDKSHDLEHMRRVFNLGMRIAKSETIQVTDYDILIPALIFHDSVIFRKDDPRNNLAPSKSADLAEVLLKSVPGYPEIKIKGVKDCIQECSFSNGIEPSTWESAILQDADKLESVGALAIMRTFSSGGEMNRPFYNPLDPLCKGEVTEKVGASIELFKKRLFVVAKTMSTNEGKRLAQKRVTFLRSFWERYKEELIEGGIIDEKLEPLETEY